MFLITVVGNVGRAETRSLPDGTRVTNFSVASNKKVKGVEKTNWVNCVAFAGLAEMLERNLEKGQKVFVMGEGDNREWDKDGVKQHRTECRVDKFEFMSSKQDSGGDYRPPANGNQAPPADDFDGDVPF